MRWPVLHWVHHVASTQPRRFPLCGCTELSCNHVWSGPILTELRAWASLIQTWGMELIFFSTEGLGSAMWFSKLSFHKMWPLPHCMWGLTSPSSQSVLSARFFQVEISNASCSASLLVQCLFNREQRSPGIRTWDPFLGQGCACSLCHQLFNTKLANVRHQPPSQQAEHKRKHWFSASPLVQKKIWNN